MTNTSKIDISICWQFPGVSPLDGLRRLADIGYEGVELWNDTLKAHPLEEWVSALQATGMRVFQLCPYFNFMEGQPKLDTSRAMLYDYLASARTTGCKRIRVFTGPPWGVGVVGAKQASDQQWSDAITSLREYCEEAAKDGVELCLECHEGSLMEDSPSALRLIHAIDHPNLTVNLQIPFKGESWETSVKALGRYTTHIHIHNWVGIPDESDLTFLDNGTFDWYPVVDLLVTKYGRRLTLSPEHITHGNIDDAWVTAARDVEYLRKLRTFADGE